MLNFGSALKPPRNITPVLALLGPIPIGRISGSDCKFRIQNWVQPFIKDAKRRQKSPHRHVRIGDEIQLDVFDFLCNRSVKPASPRELHHVRLECRPRFEDPSASDRDQNKRRDNRVEVWFPTVKRGNETRAPCKQRNRLHFFVWRRLGPCWECKENREQKCKQNSWAAQQEWGCASVGEESAASIADSEPRNQIRGGGLHVRHQESEPLPQVKIGWPPFCCQLKYLKLCCDGYFLFGASTVRARQCPYRPKKPSCLQFHPPVTDNSSRNALPIPKGPQLPHSFQTNSMLCFLCCRAFDSKRSLDHGMGYPSTRRNRPQLRSQLVRQRRALD